MNFVDFHVHIDFYNRPQNIIRNYEDNEIYALFVTNLPELFAKHLESHMDYSYIRLALGYHPEMVDHYDFDKESFNKYLDYTNYIGEVGLDFTTKNEISRKKQINAFEYICSVTRDKSKIFSIHSRKAEEEVLKILKENSIKFAVFHWYTGKLKLINEIINQGYYFSINYNMLKSKKGKDVLAKIPLDRILLETDGPFTRFNKKIINPEYIESIYNEFNKYYGITHFKQVVYSNFRKLLVSRAEEEKKKENSYLKKEMLYT